MCLARCKIVVLVSLYWIALNILIITYYLYGEQQGSGDGFPRTDPVTRYETRLPPDPEENDDRAVPPPAETNVSRAYPARLLRPWRPAAAEWIAADGPGEGGRPVTFDDGSELAVTAAARFAEHQFNVVASDAVSLNRSLPDARWPECKRKRYPALLPATSVIIVFFNEARSTLLRTVWSVINRSPRSLVNEIVLVDDGSDLDFLGKDLEDYLATLPVTTKLIRKPNRTGIVEARLLGVKHAISQILTFLDAHCECNIGWLEPLLARIVANRKTVVAPFIDTITFDTFEIKDGDASKMGGFSWNLGYMWVLIPQREYDRRKNEKSEPIRTPVVSGGLFSIDKEYFIELGSYDENMFFWGGDNVELSFKVWMCGGVIEIVPCSRVGHVFRHVSPYPFPGGIGATVGRNLLRVAKVWMDDWKFVHYIHNRDTFDVDVGDVSKRFALRNKLKCKSFRWYLKHIYPEFVSYEGDYFSGQVLNVGTGQCLDTLAHKINENIGTNSCYTILGGTQSFGLTPYSLFLTEEIHCLGTLDNSELVVLCKCQRNKSNLMWLYDRLMLTIVHIESQKCLEPTQSASNSSPVVLNTCNDSQNQKWILNLLSV